MSDRDPHDVYPSAVNDRHFRESERPPVDPLREAALAVMDVADLWADDKDNALWDDIPVELADRLDALRAALASPAAPRPEGLPTDGLARLITDILRKYGGTMKGRGDHDIFDALVRYRAALDSAAPRPEGLTRDALANVLAEVLAPPVDPVRGGFTELADRILARLSDTGDNPNARVEAYVEDVGGPEGVTAAGLRAAMLGETPIRTEHRQECSCSVCYVKRP